MMTSDIETVVAGAVARLHGRPLVDQWTACATLWVRLWVLGSAGWLRWPQAAQRVFEALKLAMERAAGQSDERSAEFVLVSLEALDVEDDGSPEWQHMIDLAAMLGEALTTRDPREVLEGTVRTFLEGVFNVLANELASRSGRAVSQAEAAQAIGAHDYWESSVALVRAL